MMGLVVGSVLGGVVFVATLLLPGEAPNRALAGAISGVAVSIIVQILYFIADVAEAFFL